MEEVLLKYYSFVEGGKTPFSEIKQIFVSHQCENDIISYLNNLFLTKLIRRSSNRKFIININKIHEEHKNEEEEEEWDSDDSDYEDDYSERRLVL